MGTDLRAPHIGMSPDTAYRSALEKEWMRYAIGQQIKSAYAQAMLSGSPLSGGLSRDARRVAQPARMGMSAASPEVGGPEDAAASFQLAIQNGTDLVRMMRERYEAQQADWKDYAKQAGLQYGGMLLGMG